eukprot:4856482-Amphidinium_carterae.2
MAKARSRRDPTSNRIELLRVQPALPPLPCKTCCGSDIFGKLHRDLAWAQVAFEPFVPMLPWGQDSRLVLLT